jgi:hypothetical protein
VGFFRLIFGALRTRSPDALAQARHAILVRSPTAHPGSGADVYYLSRLGFDDDAFDLANRLSVAGLDHTGEFFVPNVATLRRDARFMPLMAKLGLLGYWRSSGQWPDFCSEPGLPYDCKAEAAKLAR